VRGPLCTFTYHLFSFITVSTHHQNGISTVIPLSISPAAAPVGTSYGSEVGARVIPGVYTVTSALLWAVGRMPVLRKSFVILVDSWSTTGEKLVTLKSNWSEYQRGKEPWSSPCRTTSTDSGSCSQVNVSHSVAAL